MTDRIWKRVNEFAVQWLEPLLLAVPYRGQRLAGVRPRRPDPRDPSTERLPRSAPVRTGQHPGQGIRTERRRIPDHSVTATRLLTGRDLPTRVLETLSECFRALLQHEYVFQVGLMLARDAKAVRMCIRLGSAAERTIEYLRQVGWPGSDRDLLRRPGTHYSRWTTPGSTSTWGDRPSQDRAGSAISTATSSPTANRDGAPSSISCSSWLVHTQQTRRAADVLRLRRRERARCCVAASAAPRFTATRRALAEHLRADAPPRQDRVPTRRTSGGKGVPCGQPPLAHAPPGSEVDPLRWITRSNTPDHRAVRRVPPRPAATVPPPPRVTRSGGLDWFCQASTHPVFASPVEPTTRPMPVESSETDPWTGLYPS